MKDLTKKEFCKLLKLLSRAEKSGFSIEAKEVDSDYRRGVSYSELSGETEALVDYSDLFKKETSILINASLSGWSSQSGGGYFDPPEYDENIDIEIESIDIIYNDVERSLTEKQYLTLKKQFINEFDSE